MQHPNQTLQKHSLIMTLAVHLYLIKFTQHLDNRSPCQIYPKISTSPFFNLVMDLKYCDGMANSVDHDQTAPLGAV